MAIGSVQHQPVRYDPVPERNEDTGKTDAGGPDHEIDLPPAPPPRCPIPELNGVSTFEPYRSGPR